MNQKGKIMFERIKISKINDHIWLLNDKNEATGYLVLGKEKALVIDTMMGYEDVYAVVRTLTNLPLIIVNTHGHSDHIYGNIYFKEVYIHPKDIELAKKEFEDPRFRAAVESHGLKPAEFREVGEGDLFDLGGLTLEVYETPGHTPGSIVLLDRADHILFTGDTIIEQTWMQLEESMPMETLLKSLNKIQKFRNQFDYVLTGHSRQIEDALLCEAHRTAVKEVCDGMTENDVIYEWFGGTCMAHPYGKEPRRIVYQL